MIDDSRRDRRGQMIGPVRYSCRMRRHTIALVVVAACSRTAPVSDEDVKARLARAVAQDQLANIEAAKTNAERRGAHIDVSSAAMLAMEHERNRGYFACVMAQAQLTYLAPTDRPLADHVERMCKHDLPLAEMQSSVAIVEALRPSGWRDAPCMTWIGLVEEYELLAQSSKDEAENLGKRYTSYCGDMWRGKSADELGGSQSSAP
jgi:hypothetical protein